MPCTSALGHEGDEDDGLPNRNTILLTGVAARSQAGGRLINMRAIGAFRHEDMSHAESSPTAEAADSFL